MSEERNYVPSKFHLSLMERIDRALAWRDEPFQQWQSNLRNKLQELIGDFPGESGRPVNFEVLAREQKNGYRQLKFAFQSEENMDVPGYLLIPEDRTEPLPVMICLQGHSSGMHISIGEPHSAHDKKSIAGDRDYAVQAVRNGFLAVVIEQRCFGEREETLQKQRFEHRCIDATMHSLMLGRTMQSERVWDVKRTLDVVEGLPELLDEEEGLDSMEIDRDRIGCMGNSGGGTTTFYSACLDSRIRLAVVSCAFCTFADSIMRIRHCPDNFIPGILKVAEMPELAGLIAPRKLLVVAGEEDPIFPIKGVEKAFDLSCEIFEAAGCPDNIQKVIGAGGHRFYAEPAWPIIKDMMSL